jgi:hypothetical protein
MYTVTVIGHEPNAPLAVSEPNEYLIRAVKSALRTAKRIDPTVFETGTAVLTIDFDPSLIDSGVIDNHDEEA